MKLLLIGGTYFFGRVFTMLASEEHELHLIHRGTYSMKDFGVTEYLLDRHDGAALEKIEHQRFDAVVDFCGYEPGDIVTIFKHLHVEFERYVFVSTVDAYARSVGAGKNSTPKTERTPLEQRSFGGDAGAYISGKVQLEQELEVCCRERGVSYTIVRPSILYGPYNYAPRESVYIRQIIREGRVFCPEDADGAFQFVYVKDAALMLLALCGDDRAADQAYNLCGEELLNYEDFMALLTAVSDRPFTIQKQPASVLMQAGMPLPFPVTAAETQIYDGRKVTVQTGLSYTPVLEGMKKTYNAFAGVYGV
jgi:nucleoside-diphosphate-sugar epimerase